MFVREISINKAVLGKLHILIKNFAIDSTEQCLKNNVTSNITLALKLNLSSLSKNIKKLQSESNSRKLNLIS